MIIVSHVHIVTHLESIDKIQPFFPSSLMTLSFQSILSTTDAWTRRSSNPE